MSAASIGISWVPVLQFHFWLTNNKNTKFGLNWSKLTNIVYTEVMNCRNIVRGVVEIFR